ncbi:MAG: ribosomal-protein-alanine N-acetyltransferase [Betaproteobacteria bacterium RIFCSPLOWO2_02_FULL_62_17]|nr:MAG: ribosomal-protein-alanine N-acetyltransferase [Betaproteobacteria bacterium RIFCSPLOWO2_02_FULL_62_17]
MSAVPQPRVQYQPMRDTDLVPVTAIEESIYEFPWTRGNFLDSLHAGYTCWLCQDTHGLVGYAVLMNVPDEVHLLNLSIAGHLQRRGHGARMLEFLIDNARSAKLRRMILEVRPSNDGGRRLYANFGFREAGIRRDYYPAAAGREDALVLALDL